MLRFIAVATLIKRNFKMSKTKFDCDGFQIVTSKRNPKNKPTKIPSKDIQFNNQETEIDTEITLRRIHTIVEDLRVSNYFCDVFKSVSTLLQSRKLVEILCFGLGHIGECNISKYQLGLLLCFKELCNPKKVLIHDPIFYKSECDILKQLGLEIIEENKEGNYIISEQDITLVYLPHCPKQLTNNFLWSNWGSKLENCILICNSFTSLIENQPSRILLDTVPYIHKIFPYINETKLENNFKYTDIFNDISVHHFPKEKLGNISSDFWIRGERPQYKDTEEFITSFMIEKLTI